MIDPKTLSEVALGIKVHEQYLHAELSQPEGIEGRTARLAGSPFKVEKYLPPFRCQQGGFSEALEIKGDIMRIIDTNPLSKLGLGECSLNLHFQQGRL